MYEICPKLIMYLCRFNENYMNFNNFHSITDLYGFIQLNQPQSN